MAIEWVTLAVSTVPIIDQIVNSIRNYAVLRNVYPSAIGWLTSIKEKVLSGIAISSNEVTKLEQLINNIGQYPDISGRLRASLSDIRDELYKSKRKQQRGETYKQSALEAVQSKVENQVNAELNRDAIGTALAFLRNGKTTKERIDDIQKQGQQEIDSIKTADPMKYADQIENPIEKS